MALIIKSSFHSDVPRDVAWKVITDIERAAPCFPGAELGERQVDGSYKGAFNVKLGPLSFRFAGKFGFLEMDQEAGTATVTANGSDTKGRGGAQALVNVTMVEADNRTEVQLVSDVTLSGSVAQYGRGAGMIQALSQQLINEFARNLSTQMAEELNGGRSPGGAGEPRPQPESAAPLNATGLLLRTLKSKFTNS